MVAVQNHEKGGKPGEWYILLDCLVSHTNAHAEKESPVYPHHKALMYCNYTRKTIVAPQIVLTKMVLIVKCSVTLRI